MLVVIARDNRLQWSRMLYRAKANHFKLYLPIERGMTCYLTPLRAIRKVLSGIEWGPSQF